MVENSSNNGPRFDGPVGIHKLSVAADVSPAILRRVVNDEERTNPEFRVSQESKLISAGSAEMILALIEVAKKDGRILAKVDKYPTVG